MRQAGNSASPVQGQNSLAAQPGGSAAPAAVQAASHATALTAQTVAVTRSAGHAAVRQQGNGSLVAHNAGWQVGSSWASAFAST